MDVIELLEHDHRMVEQLLRDYGAARSDSQRRGVVEILIRELSKHAALEELAVYPLAKRRLDGQSDVERQLAGHRELKRLLAGLDRLEEGSSDELSLLLRLAEAVQHHVSEEEQEFFPALRRNLDESELEALGRTIATAKRVAPTRPHPEAPEGPPLLAMASPVVSAYDRFRDRIQRRPLT